jgi:hypothetical protein
MSKPFQFRHARLLAGALILGCAGILITALLHSRGFDALLDWEPHRHVRVQLTLPGLLPAEAARTDDFHVESPRRMLVRGSRVEVLGQTIGIVEDVWLGRADGTPWPQDQPVRHEDCRIIGRLKIRGDFARLVKKDSVILLREDLAGFGSVFLDILPGGQDELLEEKDAPLAVIRAESPRSAVERMAGAVGQQISGLVTRLSGLHDDIKPLLQKDGEVQRTLLEAAAQMKALAAESRRLIENADKTSASFLRMADSYKLEEQMRADVAATAADIRRLAQKLGSLDVGNMHKQLLETVAAFEKSALALEETGKSFRDTSEGLQKTWLLRGPMKEVEKEKIRAAPGPVPPQKSTAPPPPSKPEEAPGFWKRIFSQPK